MTGMDNRNKWGHWDTGTQHWDGPFPMGDAHTGTHPYKGVPVWRPSDVIVPAVGRSHSVPVTRPSGDSSLPVEKRDFNPMGGPAVGGDTPT